MLCTQIQRVLTQMVWLCDVVRIEFGVARKQKAWRQTKETAKWQYQKFHNIKKHLKVVLVIISN